MWIFPPELRILNEAHSGGFQGALSGYAEQLCSRQKETGDFVLLDLRVLCLIFRISGHFLVRATYPHFHERFYLAAPNPQKLPR